MSKIIYLLLLFFICSHLSFAQGKKDKFEDEKIALHFFMDSIYPVRPILKNKVLYSDGQIWHGRFYIFAPIIPQFKKIVQLYEKEADDNINGKIQPVLTKPKDKYIPKKWGVKKKNEDCYLKSKKKLNQNKKLKYLPSSGYVYISSIFYDSTKAEKLVAIKVLINGFSQDYKWASYAFVIKNKEIIYWRKREE